MKKMHLLFFSLLIVGLCFSQTQKSTINGVEFTIKTIAVEFTEQTEIIEIYRNNKLLLTHTLSEFIVDCSSENIELGAYEIKDSNIIFYSYWASGDRMGMNIYPFGFRKQIYSVDKKGIVRPKSSKLYIETYVDDYKEHIGMKYLKIEPKNHIEKHQLNEYVAKAEKMYGGYFVLGKSKMLLEKEVRKKLDKTILDKTDYWKEVYKGNCNM